MGPTDKTVRIRLTQGCSQRCAHCPDSARYLPEPRQLALDALEARLIEVFARWDPASTHVIVTGGEPTEHPHWREAIATLRRRPIAKLTLATNGVRLAAAASELPAGVDQLYLSADLGATSLLRSPEHAAAAELLLGRLRDAAPRPMVWLNVMVFERPMAQLARQMDRLFEFRPDRIRLLRYDDAELPARARAPGLAVPSDATWRALQGLAHRWNRERMVRTTCIDRRRNLDAASPHVVEIGPELEAPRYGSRKEASAPGPG